MTRRSAVIAGFAAMVPQETLRTYGSIVTTGPAGLYIPLGTHLSFMEFTYKEQRLRLSADEIWAALHEDATKEPTK
jgi:hypothetical protein